jgi:hypothetical protein
MVIAGRHGQSGDGAARGALWLPPDRRLVVPVISGAGGVGRSTVTALLAAALHRHTITAPGDGRGCAVLDCAARGQTPWPGWLSSAASAGTSTLAGFRGASAGADLDLVQLADAVTSHVRIAAPSPLRVLTDTGPASGSFLGGDPGPRWWLPVLTAMRTAVVDGDALEGARLAAQAAGGPLSSIASWFATPFLNTAAVWVTDTGESSLQRTIDSLTCLAEARLPVDRVVVAVSDRRGRRRRGSGGILAEGWRELIEGRVGAVVELGHDRQLADEGGCPRLDAAALDRAEVLALVQAVAMAARLSWISDDELFSFDPSGAPGPAPLPELLLRQAGHAALR